MKGRACIDRATDLDLIIEALGQSLIDSTPRSAVALGDSLELLKQIPDASVSLILCDPPYHSTQKSNIRGDTAFSDDGEFLRWMLSYAQEWQRILRMSGSIYVFCSTQMSSRLEVGLSDFFLPVSNITWTKPNEPGFDGWKGKMRKEALRQWYPHTERILMFEQGSYGKRTATRRTSLAQYLRECRAVAGLSSIELAEEIGAYGNVNHGGAVSNWESGRNVPSREQYEGIAHAIWDASRSIAMQPYNDVVRPMNLRSDVAFTDVWLFESVRPFKGKHPAAKPYDLLEHIIKASTYPQDIVLDCFAGSGSTGIAAVRRSRRAVCIDIDEKWAKRSALDISDEVRTAARRAVLADAERKAPQSAAMSRG